MDVQKIIARHGFTQKQVAAQMVSQTGKPVNQSSLSFSISPNGNPTMKFLRQIATIIGANMGEFFEDEIENPNDNLNMEKPEIVGEITMNGEKYGLVKIE